MNWRHISLLRPVLLLIAAAMVSVGCSALEEHDGVVMASPLGEMKCTCSPCGNPCGVSPPPPSPLPPPPPKSPSTAYCPPPPPAYIIVGPPGNLYPLDPNYNIGGAHRSHEPWLPALGMCVFLVFWV